MKLYSKKNLLIIQPQPDVWHIAGVKKGRRHNCLTFIDSIETKNSSEAEIKEQLKSLALKKNATNVLCIPREHAMMRMTMVC